MPHSSVLTSLLGVTLATGTLAPPPAEEGSTAVLGLEGEDDAAARALTEALRRAFEKRFPLGGEKLTVGEVRLMMGCDEDAVECLAQAGASMGVDRLVYGTIAPADGGGVSLELHVLDTAENVEEARATRSLSPAQLETAALDAAAEEIVATLFPEPEPAPALAPAVAEPSAEPAAPTAAPPARARRSRGDLDWGPYQPRPRWKWAGFGVGLGLTAAGAATVIGTYVMLDGPLRDDLHAAAEASLTDERDGVLNTANDVDPTGNDLCAAARTQPPGQPGTVTNAAVTGVCNEADALEVVNAVGFGVMAAGVVTTAVFTTLLFVHRKGEGRARASRPWQVAGVPLRGGFALQAGLAF